MKTATTFPTLWITAILLFQAPLAFGQQNAQRPPGQSPASQPRLKSVTPQTYAAELVSEGQVRFGAQCGFCHGKDAAGGESGPDLTRSQLVAQGGFDHATLGHEVCRRWHLPESVCEMVRVHHKYGEARRQIPPEVASLVLLVQEADCVSFGLLRNPTSAFPSDVERNRSIVQSLYPLSVSERVLPAAKLAEELVNIDREARLAAAVIQIAYS